MSKLSMRQRRDACLFTSLLFFVSFSHVRADNGVDARVHEAFAPIRWGLSEAEIRKAFQGFAVAQSELEGTVVDERGNRVHRKGVVISVQEYPVFGGALKADVSFLRRQHYQSISIDPGKGWTACEFVGQLVPGDKKRCEKEFKEFVDLRKQILRWLVNTLPVKGRRLAQNEVDDPLKVGGAQVREVWEWKTGGLRYVFDWHREDVVYTFSVNIVKDAAIPAIPGTKR